MSSKSLLAKQPTMLDWQKVKTAMMNMSCPMIVIGGHHDRDAMESLHKEMKEKVRDDVRLATISRLPLGSVYIFDAHSDKAAVADFIRRYLPPGWFDKGHILVMGD